MDARSRGGNAPAVLVTEKESGRVVAFNQAALDLLDLSRESVIGRTTIELGIWQDEGHRNSFLACLAIEGSMVRYPVRVSGADGRAVEVFASAEHFESLDSSLLVTRFWRDSVLPDASADEDETEVVGFLSRSATKFLVDEGADLYHLVTQELRTLIPHSIVAATSYDAAASQLALQAYSAPDGFSFRPSVPPDVLPVIEVVPVNDLTRGLLLKGELFEITRRPLSSEPVISDERILRTFDALGVVSAWMIGLTWAKTVYGAVALLVRVPDSPPDRTVVETFVRQAAVALQRNERSRALRESLHEKETLLREIHHRVKNNLQIVASLLKLQGGAVRDASTLTVLGEAADRVQSMALVHTMLYDNRNLSSVDAGEFLRALTMQIIRGGRFDASGVRLEFDLQSIRLDPDHAVPIGLIVNELVTNALKYGMPKAKELRLFIAFRQAGEGRELVVSDSGGALPADFKPEATRTLGMQLVASLTRQLRGTLAFSAGGETVFRICFPV